MVLLLFCGVFEFCDLVCLPCWISRSILNLYYMLGWWGDGGMFLMLILSEDWRGLRSRRLKMREISV